MIRLIAASREPVSDERFPLRGILLDRNVYPRGGIGASLQCLDANLTIWRSPCRNNERHLQSLLGGRREIGIVLHQAEVLHLRSHQPTRFGPGKELLE